MYTERDLKRCLKLLGLTSSEHADGELAAMKLQELIIRHGITPEVLVGYIYEHEYDYAYQLENFIPLCARMVAVWQAADPDSEDPQTAQGSEESPPNRISIKHHTRKSRKGKVHVVRDHWRYSRRKPDPNVWRKDPSVKPGDDYEWIEGHERWYCHAGQGRKIQVRGYWHKKSSIALKKAA